MNSLLGDRATWRTDEPTYSQISYPAIVPNTDLAFESRVHGIEYSLSIAPGADLGRLRFRYEGALDVKVSPDGSALDIVTGIGTLKEDGLVVLQEGRPLPARYVASGPLEYTIQIEGYDPSRALAIDPVLSWSTFLGGNLDPGRPGQDYATCVAADSAGNVYVGGFTNSANFPLLGAFDRLVDVYGDGFVTKLSPTGTLVWSTYLGGQAEQDEVDGLAVDGSGNVYVTGWTNASDFPILGGLGRPYNGTSAFVAKISSAGALVWSSFLGGSYPDYGRTIAVNGSGEVYVAGETSSTDFPIVGGFGAVLSGGYDAFVVKINAAGTAIVWSTFLGGSGDDFAYGIALDGSGNVFLTGATSSANFPSTGGFQTVLHNAPDAYVTKINPSGTAILWSTYLGGLGADKAHSIVSDGAGHVFVTGETTSYDFPTKNGWSMSTIAGGAFVTKIADGLTPSILWSSYLEGSGGQDAGRGIAFQGSSVYITGQTINIDFPSANGFNSSFGGISNAFVTKVSDSTVPPTITWSSFLGGSGYDSGAGIALDGSGNLFIVGQTQSSNFPSTGGFDTSLGAYQDAFVTKVNDTTAPPTLAWSTYLGGSSGPAINTLSAIAVDGASNVIVVGDSPASDFPTTPGAFDTTPHNDKATVTKYSSAGVMLWSTVLGGSQYEYGSRVTTDAAGNIYVAGHTSSPDFPVVGGFDGTLSGTGDVFIAKLSPSGSSLVWSTLLGGSGDEGAFAITLDPSGAVYVGGYTSSTNFPALNGMRGTLKGSSDGFVTKIAPDGASIVWSTLVGGSGDDSVAGIVLDAAGNVYLAGGTSSADLPVPGGFDTALSGSSDGFVMKITVSGTSNPSLGWATYLGGSSDDSVGGLALSDGALVVVGQTSSTDFPTPGGFQPNRGGPPLSFVYSGWIAKINISGPSLAWGTYLGGSRDGEVNAVAIDPSGDIFVTGETISTDFPTLNPFTTGSSTGAYDVFVTRLLSDGSGMVWSTRFGGSYSDFANGIALDGSGNLYIVGQTASPDFPTLSAFQPNFQGNNCGYVARISDAWTPPVSGGTGGHHHRCGLMGAEALLILAARAVQRRFRRGVSDAQGK
ncbi:MAG TPA: SBBP repeat-containing protein [Planctomycetota bacterium]|nr:SBBP repeat-containing protein [Planctomycetota bacterium]